MTSLTRNILLICLLTVLSGPILPAFADPNVIEIDQFRHVICEQNFTSPMGTETLRMTGRATVHVIFEGTQEGLADDDDGDNLDEVDTRMVELDLSGLSPLIGPVQMRLRAAYPSTGLMEETANNKSGLLEVPPFGTGNVQSFFDMFFELDVAGQTLYGQMPMRLQGELTHKPPAPIDVYENIQQIQMLTINGDPAGVYLGPGRFLLNPIVEVDVFEHPRCRLELQIPDGSTIIIFTTGRSTEHVFFEGALEGSAFDDDGDLLDEVQTQMVQMDLSGLHFALGTVNMRLNTDLHSLGGMEERTNSLSGVLDVPPFTETGGVDSFFDIYFELDIGALGQTFYNIHPMRLGGVLTHKPAGPTNFYENLVQIELVDQFGQPSGFFINACRYIPNPIVEVDMFDTSIGSLELITPGGKTYPIELEGNSTMRVFFEDAAEGTANDDDGDARDEVSTELVQLDLSGSDSDLGAVNLRLDDRRPTMGEIEEVTDTETGRLDIPPFAETGSADSFFDVYFELEALGEILYGQQPMRWRARINRKPVAPGDIFEGLEVIKLVDVKGNDTGYALGATRYEPLACGDSAHPYPIGDLNFDCEVNFKDVAIIGLHWLECTKPQCD